MPNESKISSNSGILLYLNVNGRIQDAVENAENLGAKVIEPIHGIGPHEFRAIILDSEGEPNCFTFKFRRLIYKLNVYT